MVQLDHVILVSNSCEQLQFQNIEEGNTIGKEEIYNTLVNSQGAMEAQKKMQEDIRWAGLFIR